MRKNGGENPGYFYSGANSKNISFIYIQITLILSN